MLVVHGVKRPPDLTKKKKVVKSPMFAFNSATLEKNPQYSHGVIIVVVQKPLTFCKELNGTRIIVLLFKITLIKQSDKEESWIQYRVQSRFFLWYSSDYFYK